MDWWETDRPAEQPLTAIAYSARNTLGTWTPAARVPFPTGWKVGIGVFSPSLDPFTVYDDASDQYWVGGLVGPGDSTLFSDLYAKGDSRADLNADGHVNADDATLFTSEYLKQEGAACKDD